MSTRTTKPPSHPYSLRGFRLSGVAQGASHCSATFKVSIPKPDAKACASKDGLAVCTEQISNKTSFASSRSSEDLPQKVNSQ
ncbi:hypothetical protein BaRGS_00025922 [Batillaria attramentaria]|uniref:Uncharacterized protein n=1 Tax=Batillaria attramentaria TaxID=370345 RepID=A0ABD0K6E5_9CAEN